ncbi:Broad specificity phosphatase PhoE [Geosmithia morbida]|uniref:Broad specificity phosphatase PhoE n=1 Tax=Geosmithia morbida TaxID=1094350 RepID=A0A9P5D8Y0_9HYPO|nr:Broad specificity phosphatase PhoE [Geosmithia morbida]KAF4125959.1 Broad specificity phosphatase PhoE [Geosmithia morbida]
MPPCLVLIRHAQAIHNCSALRQNIYDRFGNQIRDISDAAIIASPMHRTLQTAEIVTGWLVDRGVKIVANADWQAKDCSENSDKPCDTGSPIIKLESEFPAVDFSTVDPVWPDKTTAQGKRYAYTRPAILARGRQCLEDLYRRPEKFIFVVSHSAFLRLGVTGYKWMNGDYRIFTLEEDGSGIVKLRQDNTTLSGGLGMSPSEPVELGSEDLLGREGH